MYVTSMVAVQHWFDRKRAMATGLAVSGSGVGTLVFGFLTQYLLDSFDWQWTLRIEALIMLLGVICGILFRPLPKSEDISDDSMHLTDSQKQENDIKNGRRWQEEEEDQNKGCCGDCGSLLKETFDFSLFKRPVFALYCFVIVMFCFGYHVPYTYTPERAQGLGVDPQSASFLVSIMGISNVCARLIFGWLGDRSPNIRFYLAGIVLTCGGVVSILVFLFTTYPLMVLYAILFGAFTGMFLKIHWVPLTTRNLKSWKCARSKWCPLDSNFSNTGVNNLLGVRSNRACCKRNPVYLIIFLWPLPWQATSILKFVFQIIISHEAVL